MRNILIFLILSFVGFSIGWFGNEKFNIIQVKSEQIAKWKEQWCSENCQNTYDLTEIDFEQICYNFFNETKEEEIKNTQREASLWLEGFKDGYKTR